MSELEITVEEFARIVSRRVPSLKKFGNEWVGLCPIHDEKKPSFTVYLQRDGEPGWHCFGCGAGGNVRSWLKRMDGKSYRQTQQDRELARQRYYQRLACQAREAAIRCWRDGNPDSCIPDWLLKVEAET